ncbi:MAG: hypothetical protein KME16_12135 [Scytolyngbya sp. HA4215-MV1]|jgi:hypothetical protein|nr:hypothetical protein [Scytolyngbya sp. HA4215-MV1]
MRVVEPGSVEEYHYHVQALSLRLRRETEPEVKANLARRLAEGAAKLAELEQAQIPQKSA